MKFCRAKAAPRKDISLGSEADVAETGRHKNMIYFIEKIIEIKSPHKVSVIKRKLIVKAKHSRIMAMDLYGNVDN